jgi:3-isopropylmalate/(R)-2-methylmalate dehydratase large subunit
MEERMTICNMSIEAGARAGMIGPDEKTFLYLEGRQYVPKGKDFERSLELWKQLKTDDGAVFDKKVSLDASEIAPQVSWGTSPGMVTDVTGVVPDPNSFTNPNEVRAATQALEYIGLSPGTPIQEIKVDRVFIGSCTNSRLEDLTSAARVVKGKKVNSHVRAMVVPGSQLVKREAEKRGIDKILK